MRRYAALQLSLFINQLVQGSNCTGMHTTGSPMALTPSMHTTGSPMALTPKLLGNPQLQELFSVNKLHNPAQ